MHHKAPDLIIPGIGHHLAQGAIPLEPDRHRFPGLHGGRQHQGSGGGTAQGCRCQRAAVVDLIHVLGQLGGGHGIDPGIPGSGLD